MAHGWMTPAALLIGRNPRINRWRKMRREMGIRGAAEQVRISMSRINLTRDSRD
jgi:hypothetical protein